MSDLFSAYAMQAVRARPVKPVAMARVPSALEKRLQQRQRLSRAFRVWRRAENLATLASEPRLRDFLRYLRTVDATKGNELVEALNSCEWLRGASLNVRIFALRMIAARCDSINQRLGNEPLDDPLPPATNIYFLARDILHEGGRA